MDTTRAPLPACLILREFPVEGLRP